jgi:hypothetical protein
MRGNPNWVPGRSGNPKGRPRLGFTIAEQARNQTRLISTSWWKSWEGLHLSPAAINLQR